MITGVTGFIGGALVKKLKDRPNTKIYGLVRWSHRRVKPDGYKPIYGDLKNHNDISSVIRDLKPEYVINLGALTPVSMSFEKPFDYIDANITGVVNLVETNRKFNPYLKKFIQASTPEVYGIGPQPNTPDTPMRPNSPYAVTKASADLYLEFAHRAYDFPVVTSRHANCYGRKDQNHFVIEAIATQMLGNDDVVCLGAKSPRRDFVYIDDVVDFYCKLLDEGNAGEIYTAGWNDAPSIEEVALKLKDITKNDCEIKWNTMPERPGEIPEIRLDATKAKKELGWEPKIPLDEGLKRVVEHWQKKLN